jgi:ubiquinone/menaquinone biosynthesis C-methylase UbiE
LIRGLLVRARDARWVWNLFGPIYNRQIYRALAGLYEHIADAMLENHPSQILDVGAGPGYVSLLLAARRKAVSITGVDFAVMQVRAAEKLRRRRGIENCRFELGDAMRLRFEDGRFDAVLSVGSIKHWPDPKRGVAEMHRVLAPGCWAVISETDREASQDELSNFMRQFTAWFFWDPLLLWGLRQIIFGRSYSLNQIVSFAEAAGFVDIRKDKPPSCPYTLVWARK